MAREQRPRDRRIQKTQKLLHEALGSLIREKPYDEIAVPYDEIAVKEILDRANVGRSTFYTHFKDKDELLAGGIHDLIQTVHSTELPASGETYERMIRFSLPVFEHIHRHRQAGATGMGTRGRAIIHEHLQKVLAGLIADDISDAFRGRRKTAGRIPSELLVQYVASTFVLVLNWWAETDSKLSPTQVNEVFRTLTVPTLSTYLD